MHSANIILDFSMNKNADRIMDEPVDHISLTTKVRVVLIDFGESKSIHSQHLETSIRGNIMIQAPEASKGRASVKGDVWSLGVLGVILLTQ